MKKLHALRAWLQAQPFISGFLLGLLAGQCVTFIFKWMLD